METTIGMTEKKAIAEQLRGEILTALTSGGPLTARELYDRCECADELANMTNQLGVLQKAGRVEKSGMRPADGGSRGSRSVPEYRLIAAGQVPAQDQTAQLAAVIESTLETAWSHVPATDPVAHPEIVAGRVAPEFVPFVPFDDPISAAIASIRIAPTITDPQRQASRLCDLADWLTDLPDTGEITDWLYGLADEINP